MAVNQPQQGSSTGIVNLIESHPAFSIGALVVIGALIVGQIQSGRAKSAVAAPSNLSGLATDANGNHLVYVPTSTSWTTINTNSNNDTNVGNTNNNPPPPVHTPVPIPTPVPVPTPKPPVPPPPTHQPPPPQPPKYGLVWGARHTVSSDDTNHGAGALSYIASQSTMIMHTTQHAPSSVSISAGDIVRHNPGLRTNSILRIGQSIILPSYARV